MNQRQPKQDISLESIRKSLDYDPLTGVMRRKSTGLPFTTLTDNGYLKATLFGWGWRVHRLAWLCAHGVWPHGQIDHINGDRTDNRLVNLRDVSNSVNSENLRSPKSHNRSGFLGVRWHAGSRKWMARITTQGQTAYLGLFERPEDAADAYLQAKRQQHQGCTI